MSSLNDTLRSQGILVCSYKSVQILSHSQTNLKMEKLKNLQLVSHSKAKAMTRYGK